MFDILNDSAYDIAKGLLGQAWGGDAPTGGLDFPVACTLSQCQEGSPFADLHVEIGVTETESQLSDLPWLADVTHSDVVGPSDTDNPFIHASGEESPPGMFGVALRSYGHVVATCIANGRDHAAYHKWFCSQWGIAEDVDLSTAVPTVRSHGAAFWGGISRKLSPTPFASLAASKQIVVKWHGTDRGKFGDNVLVDWPRLSAIARLAGAALLLEDRYKPAHRKRFDFRVVGKELPIAPVSIPESIERITCPAAWEVRTTYKAAIEHLQGCKSRILKMAQNAYGPSGAVVFSMEGLIPVEAVAKFVSDRKAPKSAYVPVQDMGPPVFDLAVPIPPIRPRVERHNIPKLRGGLIGVLYPFVTKNLKSLPLGYEIRLMIEAVKYREAVDGDDPVVALRKAIAPAVPVDFVHRIYRLYSFGFNDADKGGEAVIQLMKMLGAGKGTFQTRDFIGIGKRLLNQEMPLLELASEVARLVSRAVRERGQTAAPNNRLLRLLSAHENGDIAIAEIIRQRRNFWAVEYARRAKRTKDRRVEYQLRSKLFRHTQFQVDDSGTVFLIDNNPALVTCLETSAFAYLKKRKTYASDDPELPTRRNETVLNYARSLDAFVDPPVKYVYIVERYLESVEFLKNDLKEIIDYCLDEYRTPGVGWDLEDNDRAAVVEDDGGDSDSKEEAVVAKDLFWEEVSNVDEDDGADSDPFGEDDEDEDDEGEVVSEPMVSLASELHEDYPEYSEEFVLDAVARHGNKVPVSMYNSICEGLRKEFMGKISAKDLAVLKDGADVDIRSR